MIRVQDLAVTFNPGTPMEARALNAFRNGARGGAGRGERNNASRGQ